MQTFYVQKTVGNIKNIDFIGTYKMDGRWIILDSILRGCCSGILKKYLRKSSGMK